MVVLTRRTAARSQRERCCCVTDASDTLRTAAVLATLSLALLEAALPSTYHTSLHLRSIPYRFIIQQTKVNDILRDTIIDYYLILVFC